MVYKMTIEGRKSFELSDTVQLATGEQVSWSLQANYIPSENKDDESDNERFLYNLALIGRISDQEFPLMYTDYLDDGHYERAWFVGENNGQSYKIQFHVELCYNQYNQELTVIIWFEQGIKIY